MAESDAGLRPSLVGGRYLLLEVAGSGAMATVHRARDEVLGRTVAVKTFRTHAPDPQHEQRRRGEMEVLARLSHPNLVHLFDAGTVTGGDGTAKVTYLVMEFVEGTDLRRRLASGPLPPESVRLLGLDLAAGLAYLHGLGVVHRDIKPANILIPADQGRGRQPAKLTDFGIARLADASRLTATNTTIGTANYLSPEQARGETVGAASDVYSLGLVLLECLTGTVEFPGGAVESAVARLHRDPRIPPSLGEPWVSLLPRLLARNPEHRPTAAEVEGFLRIDRALGPASADGPTEVIGTDDGATRPLRPTAAPAPHATRTLPAAPPYPPRQPPSVQAPTVQAPMAQASARPPGSRSPRPDRAPAAPPPQRRKALLRRPLAWVLAAVVLLGVLVAVPLALRTASPRPEPPPASPYVPGPLGTHLDQLERSVRP